MSVNFPVLCIYIYISPVYFFRLCVARWKKVSAWRRKFRRMWTNLNSKLLSGNTKPQKRREVCTLVLVLKVYVSTFEKLLPCFCILHVTPLFHRDSRSSQRRLTVNTRWERRSSLPNNLSHTVCPRATQYLPSPIFLCWHFVPGWFSAVIVLLTYQCCTATQASGCRLSRTPNPRCNGGEHRPWTGSRQRHKSCKQPQHPIPRQRRWVKLWLIRPTGCRTGGWWGRRWRRWGQ